MTLLHHGRELRGHFWTIAPWARHVVLPRKAPPAEPWEATIHDDKVGAVKLSGLFRAEPRSRTALVVVHGLGGAVENHYAIAAARAAEAAGISCLRLSLRGADRRGEDYYHAGLTADIECAVASRELAEVERIFVVGYSLGGHVTLRYAALSPDPRVTKVAALCPPLDLDPGSRALDAPERYVYRRNILRSLCEIYERVAERRPVPIPASEARKITTIRDWDSRTVAPRYGFRDAAEYYAAVSVAPLLPSLRLPTLLVFAEHDPIVPESVVRPALRGASHAIDVRWIERAGHVGFPRDLDLGAGGTLGLENQVLSWLLR